MAGLIARVLVVDDYEPWRIFYSAVLADQPDLQVIGHASDGLEAVERAQELQPDLILLDIGLPTLNGIEAALQIRDVSPASKILFVSQHTAAEIVEAALSNSAGSYVVKSFAQRELLPAIKAVLEGKRFISASLAGLALVTLERGTSPRVGPIDDNPYLRFAGSPHISEFIEAVIKSTAADFAALQLYDSTNNVLRIVAQHGLESELLNYLNTIDNNVRCACNKSMNERTRIVATDISSDPHFSNHLRSLLLRAKVRSLQSTPMIGVSGRLVGVVSTHYSHRGTPSPDALKHIDDLATSFLVKINA